MRVKDGVDDGNLSGFGLGEHAVVHVRNQAIEHGNLRVPLVLELLLTRDVASDAVDRDQVAVAVEYRQPPMFRPDDAPIGMEPAEDGPRRGIRGGRPQLAGTLAVIRVDALDGELG